ncbi:hypothetical protein D3C72_1168250 [compost metagenome]
MAAGVNAQASQAGVATGTGAGADGLQLGMGARVVAGDDFIDTRGDHHAVLRQHGAKGAATSQAVTVGQINRLAHQRHIKILVGHLL